MSGTAEIIEKTATALTCVKIHNVCEINLFARHSPPMPSDYVEADFPQNSVKCLAKRCASAVYAVWLRDHRGLIQTAALLKPCHYRTLRQRSNREPFATRVLYMDQQYSFF